MKKIIQEKNIDIVAIFQDLDRDKSGCLDCNEFGKVLKQITHGNVEEAECEAAFKMLDHD